MFPELKNKETADYWLIKRYKDRRKSLIQSVIFYSKEGRESGSQGRSLWATLYKNT